MNPVEYYFTTLIEAFKNIAPPIAFLIGGYFIFLKMPFWFLKKNMLEEKRKIREQIQPEKIIHEKPDNSKEKNRKQSRNQKVSKQEKSRKTQSPEEMFGISSHEVISPEELKRKYFQLLKQNHPDRVASMGQDFKELADKNTKEINKAYETLKKKIG